jgi:hypothetical protein
MPALSRRALTVFGACLDTPVSASVWDGAMRASGGIVGSLCANYRDSLAGGMSIGVQDWYRTGTGADVVNSPTSVGEATGQARPV